MKDVNNATIEKQVEETILQVGTEIKIGKRTYVAPKPSYATMISISSLVSQHEKELTVDEEDITLGVLRYLHKSEYIAEIIAIYILGAKRLKFSISNLLRNIIYSIKNHTLKSPKNHLREQVSNECTSEQILTLIGLIVSSMDINTFFAVITFLQSVNVTKPTKVITATPYGQ